MGFKLMNVIYEIAIFQVTFDVKDEYNFDSTSYWPV